VLIGGSLYAYVPRICCAWGFAYGEFAKNARLKPFSFPTIVKLLKSGKNSKCVIRPTGIN